MDAGVCTPSLSSPLSMASLLEYVRCIPHCLRNLFASSVQLLTYATLLFINNRTVSIPASVITLAIKWAYRCEYGVQLSLQYNLPRIRLWYIMVSHTHHTICFTIKRYGLWGQQFRLLHVHIFRKELTTLFLPASISTERKRELTAGWLACRTIWATSHVVYKWVTRKSIVLIARSSCLSLFAARGIKALDVSRASSIDLMSVSHMPGQMTM